MRTKGMALCWIVALTKILVVHRLTFWHTIHLIKGLALAKFSRKRRDSFKYSTSPTSRSQNTASWPRAYYVAQRKIPIKKGEQNKNIINYEEKQIWLSDRTAFWFLLVEFHCGKTITTKLKARNSFFRSLAVSIFIKHTEDHLRC